MITRSSPIVGNLFVSVKIIDNIRNFVLIVKNSICFTGCPIRIASVYWWLSVQLNTDKQGHLNEKNLREMENEH